VVVGAVVDKALAHARTCTWYGAAFAAGWWGMRAGRRVINKSDSNGKFVSWYWFCGPATKVRVDCFSEADAEGYGMKEK
jgi:hypothetical protein